MLPTVITMASTGLSKHKIDTDEDLDDLDGAYHAHPTRVSR